MHETLPASLETWQVYFADRDGFTECSSNELELASFLMKQAPPVNISLSSLNHFIIKGAVPVNAAFRTTVVPGITSWLSGFKVKTGGSKVNLKGWGKRLFFTTKYQVDSKQIQKNIKLDLLF